MAGRWAVRAGEASVFGLEEVKWMVLSMGNKSYEGATNVVKHEGRAHEVAD